MEIHGGGGGRAEVPDPGQSLGAPTDAFPEDYRGPSELRLWVPTGPWTQSTHTSAFVTYAR